MAEHIEFLKKQEKASRKPRLMSLLGCLKLLPCRRRAEAEPMRPRRGSVSWQEVQKRLKSTLPLPLPLWPLSGRQKPGPSLYSGESSSRALAFKESSTRGKKKEAKEEESSMVPSPFLSHRTHGFRLALLLRLSCRHLLLAGPAASGLSASREDSLQAAVKSSQRVINATSCLAAALHLADDDRAVASVLVFCMT